MGTLEPGFQRLHWPPLVKEIEHTKDYPGYRYKYFTSFRELDSYFSGLCGHNWREQEWAVYWINQHKETQNDDRRDPDPIRPKAPTGNRRDIKLIHKLCRDYLDSHVGTKISTYKLARWLLSEHDINVNQATIWRFVKRYKAEKLKLESTG